MALNKKQQKIVQQVEKRVELCREFMNDWLLFNQILTSYPNPGINKAQMENQFLKIKSKLAREHKVLQQTLLDDYNLDSNTMNIVSGATNLEAIYSQSSDLALKKLQGEWHRAFIAINETLGLLEDKKARAEAGEKVFIATAEMMAGSGRGGGGGMDDSTKKTLMLIVGAIIVIAVVFYFDLGGIGSMYRRMLGMP